MLTKIAVLILIVFISLIQLACGTNDAGVQEPEVDTQSLEEQRQLEQYGFEKLYMDLKHSLEEIDYKLDKLESFKWGGSYASLSRDKGKTNIHDEVTLEEDFLEINSRISNCRDQLSTVWKNSPYKEPQNVVQEQTQLSIPDWRGECDNLRSDIDTVKRAVLSHETNIRERFTSVLAAFGRSSSGIVQNYQHEFEGDSELYLDNIQEIISLIDDMQNKVTVMEQWEFDSLEPAIDSQD